MTTIRTRLAGANWRVVLALLGLFLFAGSGSATVPNW